MLYLIHNEIGAIEQANVVFKHDGYAKRLSDEGYRFIEADRNSIVSSEDAFVKNGALCDRPKMAIPSPPKTIRAGRAVVFKRYPRPCHVRIETGGIPVHDGQITDPELEIVIPVPCIYRVMFSKWPYRDIAFEIEAVA